MNGLFIIPTGIGAEIGGHAGDATPAAKLIASCCDRLIVNPNVVNASDINEMSPNMLYVEGSIIDKFLKGEVKLEEVSTYNRIACFVNSPVRGDTINAVNAAKVTIGADIKIIELNEPLHMIATMKRGIATGEVTGVGALAHQLRSLFPFNFDAIAIHTEIECPREVSLNYFENGGVNPWGGVEAKASRLIAERINMPVAHAPLESMLGEVDKEMQSLIFREIDPRMAPEIISSCYLHSVLKGLHRAPRLRNHGLSVNDLDFMISPWGCFGPPHKACQERNIPIIYVRENTTIYDLDQGRIIAENYLEAAGIVSAMRCGVAPATVRRPIKQEK